MTYRDLYGARTLVFVSLTAVSMHAKITTKIIPELDYSGIG